jgi:hypothetical protein
MLPRQEAHFLATISERLISASHSAIAREPGRLHFRKADQFPTEMKKNLSKSQFSQWWIAAIYY